MNKHLHWQCNGSTMACTAQWQKQCICSMKTCHPRSNQKGLVLFGCSILEHAGIVGYITLHGLLLEKLVSTSKCALQSRKKPSPLPICARCARTLLHCTKGQQYRIWLCIGAMVHVILNQWWARSVQLVQWTHVVQDMVALKVSRARAVEVQPHIRQVLWKGALAGTWGKTLFEKWSVQTGIARLGWAISWFLD